MKKALLFPLQISLCTFGCLYTSIAAVEAQITPDGTTSTTINSDSNGNFTIEQGDRAGDNLFHSFGDFSVPTDGSAFFNNAADISNIFNRVTGGNISNIDGLIGANGSANLFLINPAGILFGNNARLDIGGSFFGTTADSILFEDGEFSATNLDNPPLITVNAPIGLNLRDNPGEIVNRSTADGVGLQVASGESINLIGGNVTFDAGEATAPGGRIEIGGLRDAGTVIIKLNNTLTFPEDIARANVSLFNFADINVVSEGGGSISINANNIDISGGEFGSSFLSAGILSSSTSSDAHAGDITIDATGAINISQGSGIFTQVQVGGVGNAGNIEINTTDLTLLDGSLITAGVFGNGNAGNVTVNALGDITFQGINSNSGSSSGVLNNIAPGGTGNAGNIQINAANLNIVDGGTISSTNFGFGQGNAGNIQISVRDEVNVSGSTLDEQGNLFFSNIRNTLEFDAVGNSGNIEIDAGSLTISDNAFLFNATFGQGNSGNIGIEANSLSIVNGSQINAGTFGEGNAGDINIDVVDTISLDGESLDSFRSGIFSQVSFEGRGNAGDINIFSGSLNLTNGAQINAGVAGEGGSGGIFINTIDDIAIDGESSNGFGSGIFSQIFPDGIGNAGNIGIRTSSLSVTDGGQISVATFGEGNGGNLVISADDSIVLDGFSESNSFPNSGLSSFVQSGARGDSGNIGIEAASLSIANGAQINAGTFGEGDAGNINITVLDTISIDGENSQGFSSGITSSVGVDAQGNGGGVDVTTTNLNLINGGQISASTFGQGNGGGLQIDVNKVTAIEGFTSGLFANALIEDGNGGNIRVATDRLVIDNGGRITASNFDDLGIIEAGTGQPGNISIYANQIDLISNGNINAATQSTFLGEGGNINLQVAEDITFRDDNFISAQAFAEANGGNINIDTRFLIALGENNNILASAEQGFGGEIDITAKAVFGFALDLVPESFRDSTNRINASSQFAIEGITIANIGSVNLDSLNKMIPADSTQTIAEACSSNRNSEAKSVLAIEGRGGTIPEPGLPLNSNNIYVNGEADSTSAIPAPIETSKGKIQPARGIKVTEDGKIILTAYRTNNAEERSPEIKRNCG